MNTLDELIKIYVPEADQMTYEDAAILAQERDAQAASELLASLDLEEIGQAQ